MEFVFNKKLVPGHALRIEKTLSVHDSRGGSAVI
jgi:hypothetical protein